MGGRPMDGHPIPDPDPDADADADGSGFSRRSREGKQRLRAVAS